jgi:exodeoxyribonuclease VII small subunit
LATNSGKSSSAQDGKQSACFEEALQKLEDIVHQLEEGQIGLAEALGQYEQGVKLLRQCYQLLETTERRIEVLSRVAADGEEVKEAWDDAAQSLEEKVQNRGRRRSSKTSSVPAELPAAEPCDDSEGRLF